MDFKYKYPGMYMFHAHKTEFAEKGWIGTFFVNDNNSTLNSTPIDNNSFYDTLNNSFVTKKSETTGVRM